MASPKTIFVRGYESTTWTLLVPSITDTSVKQFKNILKEKHGELVPDDIRMFFAGKEMRERSSEGNELMLSDFNLQDKSTVQIVIRVDGGIDSDIENALIAKQYDFSMLSFKFTDEPDAITGDDDPTLTRAKMSCGHAVDPNSLTAWCRSLLDKGAVSFYCPALLSPADPAGSKPPRQCKKEWPYWEVRRLALLNDHEMEYFESKLSEIACKQAIDMKECPKCRSFVERKHPTYLRAVCPVCTASGSPYEFCWNCERAWTGPQDARVECGNTDPRCEHPDLPSVRDCDELIQIASISQLVPKRRACPNCGYVAEHSGDGCKFVVCPRCAKEYCFSCLQLKKDCLWSAWFSWYKDCSKGVAAKQTSIPVWRRPTEDSCTLL